MIKELKYSGKTVKVEIKDETEHIQKHWLKGNFYETQDKGMLNWVYDNHKGGVFLDIGACIGNHTLFFTQICGADFVYAFEPVKKLCTHIKKNLSLNDIKNVELFNTALGDEKGKIDMKSNHPGHAGMNSVIKGDSVDMDKLDDILDVEKIDLVKIDVENYNIPILVGAEKTLKKHKPDIFIECQSFAMKRKTKELLESYGYQLLKRVVFNHTPTYLYQWKK